MKSISEAKDLLSRLSTALSQFDNWDVEYSCERIQETYKTTQRLLWILYKNVDDMIQEWKDEEGIDRPL